MMPDIVGPANQLRDLRAEAMTAAELRALGEPYGRGWQRALARALHTSEVTVSRWAHGRQTISPFAARAIRCVFAHEWDCEGNALHRPAELKFRP